MFEGENEVPRKRVKLPFTQWEINLMEVAVRKMRDESKDPNFHTRANLLIATLANASPGHCAEFAPATEGFKNG